ncbi:MAG: hypothetical protein ACRD3O_24405 [Terriglobia bacterium]
MGEPERVVIFGGAKTPPFGNCALARCAPRRSMVLHHFPAMTLFAFLASVVFAVINKTGLREKFVYGVQAFVLFMVIAIALGWIMYPFPRH